jgi:PAS domain S-box-containing protein
MLESTRIPESRKFLQSALDSLAANIAVLDESGTIIAVNASWCRFGHENDLQWQECGLGRNYLAVLDAASGEASEGAEEAAQGIRAVMLGRHEDYWQEYPCHSPWEKRWYMMSVTSFRSQAGTRVVVSHQDITPRRLAEEALLEAKEAAEAARREAEMARKEEESRRRDADRRRQIAESLRDILSILNSNRPLEEVLEQIVAQASILLGSQAVAIYRLKRETSKLVMQAARGLFTPDADEGRVPYGQEALERAVSSRTPVAVPNLGSVSPDTVTQDEVRWRVVACDGDPYHAILAVPIVIEDDVYGCLALYYSEPRPLAEEEVALAAGFGDQVALALENAHLRDQMEQAAVAAERSRLARDLHDAVTQTLFSAGLIAESLPRVWKRYPDQALRGLEELRQLTRGALAEMRALLLELRPAALTEKPLGELLRNLVEATHSRARMPIQVTTKGDDVLPANVQIVFYRIAQEALNNVAKHANATQVFVDLNSKPGSARLQIRDDGCGFLPDQVPSGHLGLGIMRERAESVGATVEVQSRPGHGTQVLVRWHQPGRKGSDDRDEPHSGDGR